MDFTRRGRTAATDYSELSFHGIKFHFPNCYDPLTEGNEKKVQESFHKIYQQPSSFPARSSLISNAREIDGADCILSQLEVERYGKMERRLELLGSNYRIVENTGGATSLYKAVSQALRGNESLAEKIQEEVFDEVAVQNFQFYRNDLVRSYIEVIPKLVDTVQPEKIIQAYRKYTKKPKGPASTMELHAAAVRHQFRFGIIIIWKNLELLVVNCYDPNLVKYPVKFYFLVTGKNRKNWHYELLHPLGDFVEPLDGKHKLNLKMAITLPEEHKRGSSTFTPDIPDHLYQIVFAIEDKEFLYKDTMAHNLFQILSELHFGDIEHAEAIRDILDERRIALDYVLRPKVVRDHKIIVPGALGQHTTYFNLQDYRRRCGDITYLKLAAAEFAFSTIAIGVDTQGNFSMSKTQYYDQKIVDATGKMPEVPWHYFFVRNAGNETQWHLLHPITNVETVLKEILNPDEKNVLKIHEIYDETPLVVNTQEAYTKSIMELTEKYSKSSKSEVLSASDKQKLAIAQHAAFLRNNASKARGLKIPTLPSDIQIIPATVAEIYRRRVQTWHNQSTISLESTDEVKITEEEESMATMIPESRSNDYMTKVTDDSEMPAAPLSEPSIRVKIRDSFESRMKKSAKRLPTNNSSLTGMLEDGFSTNTLSSRVKCILADYKKETRDRIKSIRTKVQEQMLLQGLDSRLRFNRPSGPSDDSPVIEEIHTHENQNTESSTVPSETIPTYPGKRKKKFFQLRNYKVAPMPQPKPNQVNDIQQK